MLYNVIVKKGENQCQNDVYQTLSKVVLSWLQKMNFRKKETFPFVGGTLEVLSSLYTIFILCGRSTTWIFDDVHVLPTKLDHDVTLDKEKILSDVVSSETRMIVHRLMKLAKVKSYIMVGVP